MVSYYYIRVPVIILLITCIASLRNFRISCKKSVFRVQAKTGETIDKWISDPNVSIGAGIAGFTLLLGNRLILGDISDVQSRADIIAVLSCSAVLLNALSNQDIVARDRDPVALVGYSLRNPWTAPYVTEENKGILSWACTAILNNTAASSVHIIVDNKVVARSGVVGTADNANSFDMDVTRMPILRNLLNGGEEVYLPDVQILPGKIEFTYLPINCQSVLILPLRLSSTGGTGAVVVGTNQAKVLKTKDTSRIRAVSVTVQEAL